MDKRDTKRFALVMAGLGEVFQNKGESAAQMEIYFQALQKYPIEEIEKAAMKVIQTRKYTSFPIPAELIEHIAGGQSIQSQAIGAWGSVMGCLEAGRAPRDSKTAETIKRLGGWSWLEGCSYDELKWQEKRFVEHYLTLGDDFKREQLPDGDNIKQLTDGIGRKL